MGASTRAGKLGPQGNRGSRRRPRVQMSSSSPPPSRGRDSCTHTLVHIRIQCRHTHTPHTNMGALSADIHVLNTDTHIYPELTHICTHPALKHIHTLNTDISTHPLLTQIHVRGHYRNTPTTNTHRDPPLTHPHKYSPLAHTPIPDTHTHTLHADTQECTSLTSIQTQCWHRCATQPTQSDVHTDAR